MYLISLVFNGRPASKGGFSSIVLVRVREQTDYQKNVDQLIHLTFHALLTSHIQYYALAMTVNYLFRI